MASTNSRIRDLGYAPGTLPTGPTNSILDVPNVHISQITIPTSPNAESGSTATKGLTVISPRPPKDFYKPCHASTSTLNGNGELTGMRQAEDWGYINTPIAFTNSLSLGTVFDGMWDWVMDRQDEMQWDELNKARHYGTPVVGETADWLVNSDTRRSRLDRRDVKRCFAGLKSGEEGAKVQEGQYGGGAGMTCHQFTGGTGTASRIVGAERHGNKAYTLGVLCQSNYGLLDHLVIGGVPIGKILQSEKKSANKHDEEMGADVHAPITKQEAGKAKDGSILILIITDGPLVTHQLNRLARHATAGLAQVGTYGIGKTFSGDIFLAASTAEHGKEQLDDFSVMPRPVETYETEVVKNECIDPFFLACAEAVEEAILNSMVGAKDGTVAMDGTRIEGLPVDRVKSLLDQYLVRV